MAVRLQKIMMYLLVSEVELGLGKIPGYPGTRPVILIRVRINLSGYPKQIRALHFDSILRLIMMVFAMALKTTISFEQNQH